MKMHTFDIIKDKKYKVKNEELICTCNLQNPHCFTYNIYGILKFLWLVTPMKCARKHA